jgi:hypothetical protein
MPNIARIRKLFAEKMNRMARSLLKQLSLALIAISCASYTPQPATLLRIQSATIFAQQRGFAVGVSPYLDPSRNRDIFQADLKQTGILPLQVVVRNSSEQIISVRKNDFLLRLADGNEFSPTSPDIIASRLESSAGVIGWTLAFGLVGFLGSSTQQGEADNARRADLRNKELQDCTLSPQESAQGFLFFLVPGNVTEIQQATLSAKASLWLEGSEIRLSLPLKELGTWNEPKRSRNN